MSLESKVSVDCKVGTTAESDNLLTPYCSPFIIVLKSGALSYRDEQYVFLRERSVVGREDFLKQACTQSALDYIIVSDWSTQEGARSSLICKIELAIGFTAS